MGLRRLLRSVSMTRARQGACTLQAVAELQLVDCVIARMYRAAHRLDTGITKRSRRRTTTGKESEQILNMMTYPARMP